MVARVRNSQPAWSQDRLFRQQYDDLSLCVTVHLSSDSTKQYVVCQLFDSQSSSNDTVAMSAVTCDTHDPAQVTEILMDAFREAHTHLTPFPPAPIPPRT